MARQLLFAAGGWVVPSMTHQSGKQWERLQEKATQQPDERIEQGTCAVDHNGTQCRQPAWNTSHQSGKQWERLQERARQQPHE
jgi:hypothetical protein